MLRAQSESELMSACPLQYILDTTGFYSTITEVHEADDEVEMTRTRWWLLTVRNMGDIMGIHDFTICGTPIILTKGTEIQ